MNHITNQRYICFSIHDEEYAVPLLSVREVIGVPEVTSIPFAPSYFIGLMNLRGQVISILDLRLKFGHKNPKGSETAVIICDFSGVSIGVVVDSVNSVIAPSATDLAEKPAMQNSKANDFVTGVYKKENRLVLLLDLGKSLSIEDQKTVSKVAGDQKVEQKSA